MDAQLTRDLLAAAEAALPTGKAAVADDLPLTPCGGPMRTDFTKVMSDVYVTNGDPAATRSPEQMVAAATEHLRALGYEISAVEHPSASSILTTARTKGFVIEVSSGAGFKGLRVSGSTPCQDAAHP